MWTLEADKVGHAAMSHRFYRAVSHRQVWLPALVKVRLGAHAACLAYIWLSAIYDKL